MALGDQDPSHSDKSGKRGSRRRKEGSMSVAETLEKWREYNQKLEEKEKVAQKAPAERSKKGCMTGKGGPENALYNYRGVWQRKSGKWVAQIWHRGTGKRLWLGSFSTSMEAALAYDEAARAVYGSSASLNFPDHNISTSGSDSNTMSSVSQVSPQGVNLKPGESVSHPYDSTSAGFGYSFSTQCSTMEEVVKEKPGDAMISGEAVVSNIEKEQLNSQNICPSQEVDDQFDIEFPIDEKYDFEELFRMLGDAPLNKEGHAEHNVADPADLSRQLQNSNPMLPQTGQASLYDGDLDFSKDGKRED